MFYKWFERYFTEADQIAGHHRDTLKKKVFTALKLTRMKALLKLRKANQLCRH